ncbi:MAG: ribosome biogenesis GTPase Der [Halanaerobiales bacterium]|nr:ribosome biogenesis GTPase Der [Halanaerobiales bacterium]
MSKPTVAIVGRPNVGKSTLFNRLAGTRISIVEDEPSITRDRIYAEAEWLDHEFKLIDTGGIEVSNNEEIKSMVKRQSELAIEEADYILFVVDGRAGLTALDEKVAQLLRKSNKKVFVVVNKIEDFNTMQENVWEFYSLGFEIVVPISAEHGKNLGDLLDHVINEFEDGITTEEKEDVINIAVVGKPNVGKSSLVNYLVGHERVIVSNIPGTTRDAIDTVIEFNDIKYNFIDTAGLRRKANVNDDIEYYSNIRAIRAIERSDGVLMMIDAQEGVTEQDKKISGYAHNAGKAMVIAINKWDLINADSDEMANYRDEVYYNLKFLSYVPVSFISAIDGKRVEEVLELLEYSVDQNSKRIKTGLLNEVITEAIQLREPPTKKGKQLKIYYCSQVGVKPPTFVFFVNNPDLMHFAYQRYLENSIRENFGFIGSPIVMKIKQRS